MASGIVAAGGGAPPPRGLLPGRPCPASRFPASLLLPSRLPSLPLPGLLLPGLLPARVPLPGRLPGLRPPRRLPRAGSADQPDPVHQLRGLGRPRGRGGGQNLAQRAAVGRGERRVLLPGQRHRDRDHLGRGEVQRRQGQRLVDRVAAAPPGLRVDRHPGFLQGQDVPLDGARTDLVALGQLPRRPGPRGHRPQLLDQRVEPIGPVHAPSRYPRVPTFRRGLPGAGSHRLPRRRRSEPAAGFVGPANVL